MSTAAAIKPRPFTVINNTVSLELVQALPEDLKVFNGHDENYKPIFVQKIGLPYWLRSQVTGKIEPTPYLITEDTDPNDIKEYLDNNMILISKSPFKI